METLIITLIGSVTALFLVFIDIKRLGRPANTTLINDSWKDVKTEPSINPASLHVSLSD